MGSGLGSPHRAPIQVVMMMDFAPVIALPDWNTDGHRVVARCPVCDEVYDLTGGIHDDGFTEHEIVCPTYGCGFNDFVRLEGW